MKRAWAVRASSTRPSEICRIAGYPAGPGQRMHPFGQVMEILPVPVPFLFLTEWLSRLSVRAAASRSGDRRLRGALPPSSGGSPLIQPVRLSSARYLPRVWCTWSMSRRRTVPVCSIATLPEKIQVIADGKRIRPEVALRLVHRRDPDRCPVRNPA